MSKFRVPLACLIWVAVGSLAVAPAAAEDLPEFTLRELTIRSDVIVVAKPAKSLPASPADALEFTVLEVLRGNAIQRGRKLTVKRMGLYSFQLPDWLQGDSQRSDAVDAEKTLLYLRSHEDKEKGAYLGLETSGLRVQHKDGTVLRPRQFRNPGGYHVVPAKGITWDGVVGRAKAEVKAVDKVFALREIKEPAKRNKVILDWIRKHRKEFGGNFFVREDRVQTGWGSLETMVFEWVLETGVLKDCWKALKLYQEIHPRARFVPSSNPLFASPKARKWMASIAFDEKANPSERRLALFQLGRPANLWAQPWHIPKNPEYAPLTAEEQTDLLDRLEPLLKAKNPMIREAAVYALKGVSLPIDYETVQRLRTERALPHLIKAYGAEADAFAKTMMSDAIWHIAGEARWKKIVKP